MSLVPLFYDWLENDNHPHSLFDQDFGHHLEPEDLALPWNRWAHHPHLVPTHHARNYLRPWVQSRNQATSVVKADKDSFNVSLDVQQFKPEEITCKVIDKHIVISGSHEEKRDEHGYISRSFTRKYLIPETCDVDQVKTSLSSDGVLSITVPKKQIQDANEKVIPIEHTGKPAILPKGEEKKKSEKKQPFK